MKHIVASLFFFLLVPFGSLHAQELPLPHEDSYYRGRVVEIPSEQYVSDFGQGVLIQELQVELINGEEEGATVTVTYEIPEGLPGSARLDSDDTVVVGKTVIGGQETYFLADRYRLPSLWLFIGLFILVVFVATGKRTIQSLLGLVISFFIILYYIVPSIAAGNSPVLVATFGTLGIATLSIFIAHGFYIRTAIAFVSTVITILLSLGLSSLAVSWLDLFGWGTEEAFFLQYSNGQVFNLQGILIAGIAIGVLGVLDDITTAQAAVVEQIYKANPTFSFVELYRRGSAVGKEHIISLVNTIALAYTGASLPLLLMFEQQTRPIWLIINSELMMEEIIRILIGSIILVLAVPLTTGLAAYYFAIKKPPISSLGGHDHAHVH